MMWMQMKKKHQKVCFRFLLSEIFYYFCNGFELLVSFVLKLCYKIKLIYPLSKPPKVLFEHRLTLFRRETPTECKVTKKFGNQMYLTTLIKLLYVDLDIF